MSSKQEGKPEATPACDGEEIKSGAKKDGPENAAGEKINLDEASKMGFNDRAWNDPPPLLMNSATINAVPASGRKLNSRVPFPLDSAAYPTPENTTRATLNPNAPPPMGGFVNASKKTSEP